LSVSIAVILLSASAAAASPPVRAPAPAAAPAAAAAAAVPRCVAVDEATVASWFDGWNLALASLDAERVGRRYWDDAVLLADSFPGPRQDPAQIRDYFKEFLAQHPRGHVDSRSTQIGCNIAIDTGIYTFSLMDKAGAVRQLPARFTYVYAFRDGEWRISHHHSSAMPVPPAPVLVAADPPPSTEAVAGRGGAKRAAATAAAVEAAAAPAVEPQRASSPLFMNAAASPGVMEFYPIEARVARETGSVRLRVCANPEGVLVGEPAVLTSSGSERLDVAARSWARAARWVPATSNRRAVEGCVELTARFEPR
jgi:uncharacterized protein (TIGR02246 family)